MVKIGEPHTIKTLSASSVKLWIRCPKCWERRYINPPEESDTSKDDISGALLFGRAFSIALEAIHRGFPGIETFRNEWERLAKLSKLKGLPLPFPSIPAGEKLLSEYFKHGIYTGEPERVFKVHVKGLPVPILGIMDLEGRDGNGIPNGIVEFKTSKAVWTQERVDTEIQGFCYWIAYFILYGRIPEYFDWLVFNTRTLELQKFSTIRTKEQCKEMLDLFREALDGMGGESFEPKCPKCRNIGKIKERLPRLILRVDREL